MKIHIFTLILIAGFTSSIHGETMQGGNYTLNGSVEVMVNQGSGGVYTLNPSGDPMGPNSTGGSFALYPTPFSFPTVPVDPITGEVIQAVVRSVSYGPSVGATPASEGSSSSTSPETSVDPSNPNAPIDQGSEENLGPGIIIGPNGVPGYYGEDGEFIPSNTGTNYGYPNATDTVNFGRGSSTASGDGSEVDTPMSPIAKTFSWLIVIILLIAILRRLWDKMQGRI